MSKRIEALLDNKALFLNSTLKEAQEEKSSFINQFKDTKYQELLAIQKELRNVQSQVNAINFQNQKQSIISPTDGYIAK